MEGAARRWRWRRRSSRGDVEQRLLLDRVEAGRDDGAVRLGSERAVAVLPNAADARAPGRTRQRWAQTPQRTLPSGCGVGEDRRDGRRSGIGRTGRHGRLHWEAGAAGIAVQCHPDSNRRDLPHSAPVPGPRWPRVSEGPAPTEVALEPWSSSHAERASPVRRPPGRRPSTREAGPDAMRAPRVALAALGAATGRPGAGHVRADPGAAADR